MRLENKHRVQLKKLWTDFKKPKGSGSDSKSLISFLHKVGVPKRTRDNILTLTDWVSVQNQIARCEQIESKPH